MKVSYNTRNSGVTSRSGPDSDFVRCTKDEVEDYGYQKRDGFLVSSSNFFFFQFNEKSNFTKLTKDKGSFILGSRN